MATNGIGAQYPTGADEFAPHLDIEGLADSLVGRVVVPVANSTAAAAVAAAVSPSASNPLYVHRADAPAGMRTEVTEDGSTWRPVGMTSWVGEAAVPTIAAGSSANVNVPFPAGYFSIAPIVLVSIRGSSQAIATNGSPTTSGVACTVRNLQTAPLSGAVLTVHAQVQP